MKVTAFSAERVTEDNKNGKCVLDLTVDKDIETFSGKKVDEGGQEVVDEFIRNAKINERMTKNDRDTAIEDGKAEGWLPADYVDKA